ncbi:CST complex subunit Stn1 N-terminal domain-containing protein [Madurella fahalii]|uniref:CST complex subunit Stn1 N-terminal domain-containing protein n=1 Tax=Madurella fahalii TaxID=1157608 RepID=A0ABQ0GDJ7_9PEZI
MTDAGQPELYPQYCFRLSPTINRWCHLRVADIFGLTSHPGFRGQDIYLHLNHPIKWVRIAGVVVAVNDRESKRIYTIDDGSGATIDCVVNVGPRVAPGTATTAGQAASKPNEAHPLPVVDAPIDVGHTIDIKGSVSTWLERRQIRAEKISHLRSTEQEMLFWEKVTLLKREVLSKPWVLDRREMRRCRREEEGKYSRHRQRDTKDRHKKDLVARTEVKSTRSNHARNEGGHRHERLASRIRPSGETGLEKRRPAKPITRMIPVTGRYDALGL